MLQHKWGKVWVFVFTISKKQWIALLGIWTQGGKLTWQQKDTLQFRDYQSFWNCFLWSITECDLLAKWGYKWFFSGETSGSRTSSQAFLSMRDQGIEIQQALVSIPLEMVHDSWKNSPKFSHQLRRFLVIWLQLANELDPVPRRLSHLPQDAVGRPKRTQRAQSTECINDSFGPTYL